MQGTAELWEGNSERGQHEGAHRRSGWICRGGDICTCTDGTERKTIDANERSGERERQRKLKRWSDDRWRRPATDAYASGRP